MMERLHRIIWMYEELESGRALKMSDIMRRIDGKTEKDASIRRQAERDLKTVDLAFEALRPGVEVIHDWKKQEYRLETAPGLLFPPRPSPPYGLKAVRKAPTAKEAEPDRKILRELGFSEEELQEMAGDPHCDISRIFEDRIQSLKREREHINNKILIAEQMKLVGINDMDFYTDVSSDIDEIARLYRIELNSDAHKKRLRYAGRLSREAERECETIFMEFHRLQEEKEEDPDKIDKQVQALCGFYKKYLDVPDTEVVLVLLGLSCAFTGGGDVAKAVDKIAGEGTAEFVGTYIRNVFEEELEDFWDEYASVYYERFARLRGKSPDDKEVKEAAKALKREVRRYLGIELGQEMLDMIEALIGEDTDVDETFQFIVKALQSLHK